MGELTLVLGGARSGKSRFAESLALEAGGNIVYLATLVPGDAEMRLRVETHRASRPPAWRTVEEPIEIVASLSARGAYDICLLDCVTLWLSNLLLAGGEAEEPGPERVSVALSAVRSLIAWQRDRPAAMIAVSNEVGSGLVPEYPLGRVYRDVLGEANQLLAAAADRAYLCVAGYALDLKAAGRQIR